MGRQACGLQMGSSNVNFRQGGAGGQVDVSPVGTDMFVGHNPYLVALSVVIAILGGYTGFGLAARCAAPHGASRRLLLAGAAGFLAVGIWTMHFIGMLAAPLPPDAVLPRPADHRLLPDLRAGGRCVAVLREHRRTVRRSRDRLGAAARRRRRLDALCRHPRAGRELPASSTSTR